MIQWSSRVLHRRRAQWVRALLVLFLVTGIGTDASAATFEFDFSRGDHGWTGGFSDYPQGDGEFYELDSGMRPLPQSAGGGNALFITGNNHSDDLFMYFTRQVSGLAPHATYDIDMSFEFATEYPVGLFGVGGAPAESVYFKAGASTQQPTNTVDGLGHLRLNIDKGNQSRGGQDMLVLGHIGKSKDLERHVFERVTRSSDGIPFSATTDAGGSLWLIFGTDSGFEATTNLYYTQAIFTLQNKLGPDSDLTNNGFVDFKDLTVLLANWNQNVSVAEGNLVNPGRTPVNFEDLTVLLAAWTGPGGAASPQAAVAEAIIQRETATAESRVVSDVDFNRLGRRDPMALRRANRTSGLSSHDAPLRRLQAVSVDRAMGEDFAVEREMIVRWRAQKGRRR